MEELKKVKHRASLMVIKNDSQKLRSVTGNKKDNQPKSVELKMPEPAQRVLKARKHDPL